MLGDNPLMTLALVALFCLWYRRCFDRPVRPREQSGSPRCSESEAGL